MLSLALLLHFTFPVTRTRWGSLTIHNQLSPCYPALHSPLRVGKLLPCPLFVLSSHLFLSALPLLLLPPLTVSCDVVLARPDDREKWPYHFSLCFLTVVRRSSYGPVACWILLRSSSLVTWSLYEMRKMFRASTFLITCSVDCLSGRFLSAMLSMFAVFLGFSPCFLASDSFINASFDFHQTHHHPPSPFSSSSLLCSCSPSSFTIVIISTHRQIRPHPPPGPRHHHHHHHHLFIS